MLLHLDLPTSRSAIPSLRDQGDEHAGSGNNDLEMIRSRFAGSKGCLRESLRAI
jgi:hypothetical protein